MMVFKSSLTCPKLGWTGCDVVAEPEKILPAIKAAGHGSGDLPIEGFRANTRQPILPAVELEVPEVMSSWADHNLF